MENGPLRAPRVEIACQIQMRVGRLNAEIHQDLATVLGVTSPVENSYLP